ncbi:MAG: RNA polymerase sigma factor [Parcubacteria group bacterium]|nr:RNA polymerase sigma factor [Parcubacteria group bacterium]
MRGQFLNSRVPQNEENQQAASPTKAEVWDLQSPRGFGVFYDYWAPRIWRHALIKTASREEAQEITSKTFLKIWEYVKRGGEIRNPTAFLYRVTDHLVIDFYRARGSNLVISTNEVPDDDHPDIAVLETEAANRYDLNLVKKCLAKLKPQEATLLLMRFVEELSIEEIARATEKSRGAVSVAIHRALKELHKVIENDHGNLV